MHSCPAIKALQALCIRLVSWLCCQVTAAVTKQLETLNTNSRYLHDKLVVLAERITQKMPEPLRVGQILQITLCLTSSTCQSTWSDLQHLLLKEIQLWQQS